MKPLAIITMGSTFAELARTHGEFGEWIAAGVGGGPDCCRILAAQDPAPLPPPEQFCGAILSGSHFWVTDREPWSEAAAA